MRRRGQHLGQQGGRNVHGLQQLGVPLVGVDVKEHGARSVADVGGVHPPAGQLPQQPAVDGAKGELTLGRHRARIGHLVQDPLQLGARKIGVHEQTGFFLNGLGQPTLAQGLAGRFGTAVLPDDGLMNRLAGFAVPNDRGFPLVGNADGAHLGRANARFGQRLARRGQLGAPDFQRIVLDPAGLGVVLGKFLLRHRNHAAPHIKNDAARAGGALVKCEQVCHGVS